mmetsp:Transcript_37936/g.81049  ORF Transcript_37936/g.81049 Transcript_37936/m.81049 type:complete len:431 (+) Transcript_37936:81-1373(+)|eukprot:CAMPEP_0172534296 /NCGR_PEP_ID=MMETSP1067-20121228/6716_1 /TAXON_ID=265564 ORGANISM="Thalassiosira punctigera, Strain Tpunct2005C2" /NCGR_SAMPLE_ID=MMETSP1067 /ASSEMBLY_ACC=CAM_ASM_000444 /LENGTH=430 /DNA_ID=CAMNT_0013319073 /DNA_START=78 /DNA_END=1370 /DNA_ORIENTATION=+
MSDAAELRATLNKTDMSAPAIQSSSRSMMRFFDKPGGATMAVSEWRSVLQTSSPSQYLPLLYVANEVLQTSKRNRGNRFLEAFSPVLGSCLQFICGRDGSVVEKVRRVVKIWGDRRVFSMRYVMEVLGGLDSYRGGAVAVAPPTPVPTPPKPKSPPASPRRSSGTANSDDEDDLFGGASDGPKLLDINIDATALSAAAQPKPTAPEFGSGAKRRRSSTTSPIPQSGLTGSVSKKPKALSGQNFLDMFQSIVNLDEKYKSSIGVIESIPPSYLDEGSTDIDDLVGDELTDMYKKVCQTQRNVRRERRTMYSVAVQRRDLEKEAKRYVSWLKNLAKVDDDDIEFCDKLEKKLDLISVCHEEAKSLRDQRRAEEAQQRAEAEAMAQREVEEEERRRILDDAKMEAEAKPGMMWNRELREYQYLHDPTEESWRD